MTEVPPVGTVNFSWKGRDAIHVAVIPVVAVARLFPGQHVNAKGQWGTFDNVGIVDPYLTKPVESGETFFLFLYPGSVTSLRHVWTHRAFESESPVLSPSKMSESEAWLRSYAKTLKSYEEPEEAFQNLLNDLRSSRLHGHGSASLYSIHDVDDREELETHASVFLNTPIRLDGFTFSCSC